MVDQIFQIEFLMWTIAYNIWSVFCYAAITIGFYMLGGITGLYSVAFAAVVMWVCSLDNYLREKSENELFVPKQHQGKKKKKITKLVK